MVERAPIPQGDKVINHGDFPISDLLPKSGIKNEPEYLSLLDSTISVKSLGNDRDRTYFARVNHPVAQQELVGMLDEVAPVKGHKARGIQADWGRMEAHDSYDIELMNRHAGSEKLATHWHDFVKNFKGLSTAFNHTSAKLVSEELSYLYAMPYGEAKREYFEGSDFREAFKDLGLGEEVDRDFYGKTVQEINEISGGQVSVETLDSYSINGDFNRSDVYEGFLKTFFNRHPELVSRDHIAQSTRGDSFFSEIDGEQYIFQVPMGGDIRGVRGAGGRLVVSAGMQSNVGTYFDGGRMVKGGEGFKVEITDDEVAKNSIYPVIAWNRRRGFMSPERNLIADPDMLTEFDMESNENPLLGVISVAYLNPDITKYWPKKQGFSKKGFKQTMHSPQVPVLALQMRHTLENSSFIANIEKAVK